MLIVNRVPLTNPVARMESQLHQWLNDFSRVPGVAGAFPPMNVWEEGEQYFIEAELPGFSLADVEVSVVDDQATVKGRRKTTEATEGAAVLKRERRGGTFERTWTLPGEIDADRVTATLRDGVLLVTLPKAAKTLPRKIAVNGG